MGSIDQFEFTKKINWGCARKCTKIKLPQQKTLIARERKPIAVLRRIVQERLVNPSKT